jgi:hypothetical protein
MLYLRVIMRLDESLKSDGARTVADLRQAIGAKSDAQVRQWQHGYADRLPSPEYSVAIEQATFGAVTCEELRPSEPWRRIPDKNWPNPKGRPVLDFAAAAKEAA